jgi:superfamily II DNA/RNA helicase
LVLFVTPQFHLWQVKEDLILSFETLQLHADLMRAIQAAGFTNATEVQTAAIPEALAGKDLMVSAQTGTGKTAAFTLPALQRLLTPSEVRGHGPRVLVLTPTRELATQVTEAIALLGRFTRLRSGSIVGGTPYPPQIKMLERPLDLLVATPGRLIDHLERGRIDFSRLEMLVLDEADRMLDMGFVDDVERIAAAMPTNRQTLLFSATLEGEILRIAQRLLKEPVRIQVSHVKQKHESITQHIHAADDIRHKHALLSHLIASPEMTQAVIFTATKRGAEDLMNQLRDKGHASAALHGDMPQGARRRTVEQMQRGRVKLLVATDVAARGLDIKGLSHVINFDLPMVAEDYVHRIGRTGRGGATGIAISLVGPQDWGNLSRIERLTGQQLERTVIAGLEPVKPEPRRGSGGGRPNGGKRFGGGGGGNRSNSGGFKPRAHGHKGSDRPHVAHKSGHGGNRARFGTDNG